MMHVALIRGLLLLTAWLPWSWLRAIARLSPFLAPRGVKRVIDTNLALCFPDFSETQRHALRNQVLVENATTVLELGKCWLRAPQAVFAQMRETVGEEHLREAKARGKGVVFMTCHFGNWEMAGLYASQLTPITSLYRPPKLARLDPLIRASRERNGGIMAPATNRGVKAMVDTLRAGGVAGILPDQDPGEGNGVFAPFFGQPAYTMGLIHRLLRKTGARAVFAYAERIPGGFRMVLFPAPEAIYDPDPEISARALNQGVEQCINAAPAQYLWSYKRFKTRPPGVARRYP